MQNWFNLTAYKHSSNFLNLGLSFSIDPRKRPQALLLALGTQYLFEHFPMVQNTVIDVCQFTNNQGRLDVLRDLSYYDIQYIFKCIGLIIYNINNISSKLIKYDKNFKF